MRASRASPSRSAPTAPHAHAGVLPEWRAQRRRSRDERRGDNSDRRPEPLVLLLSWRGIAPQPCSPAMRMRGGTPTGEQPRVKAPFCNGPPDVSVSDTLTGDPSGEFHASRRPAGGSRSTASRSPASPTARSSSIGAAATSPEPAAAQARAEASGMMDKVADKLLSNVARGLRRSRSSRVVPAGVSHLRIPAMGDLERPRGAVRCRLRTCAASPSLPSPRAGRAWPEAATARRPPSDVVLLARPIWATAGFTERH